MRRDIPTISRCCVSQHNCWNLSALECGQRVRVLGENGGRRRPFQWFPRTVPRVHDEAIAHFVDSLPQHASGTAACHGNLVLECSSPGSAAKPPQLCERTARRQRCTAFAFQRFVEQVSDALAGRHNM
jgi:hypothetical protein